MQETITLPPLVPAENKIPDVSQLVTEDDTPVDNLFSEKQQRLLVESLYASWNGTFLAASNVAIYYGKYQPPIVPDMLLSLDVQVAADWYAKEHRSYFVWEFGKPPELVVEVVSNTEGGEMTRKFETYALADVKYYLVFDPTHQLSDQTVRAFYRNGFGYNPLPEAWFEEIGLGAQLWEGKYEEKEATWLRWTDREGNVLLTGRERAEIEHARAELERERAEREQARADQEREHAAQEHERAELERGRAEQADERAELERERAERERARAERLAAKLRELGVEAE